jgi:outer membrane receptor protein involved in Fe transport
MEFRGDTVKSKLLLCTALAGTTLAGAHAVAQSNQTTSESNSQVETVIVTGNRPPLNSIPMKAPFVESTITPEAILNITPSPAMTVQTLLNTQPSIYATVGATNGMETDIKFRSFVDGEFGETIAGVPLNDVFNSGVTYQADNRNNALLITRDLDSVDIYRGINNPAVNTYNSLGGTINYIPRQPKDDFGGDVGVDGGSFGTLDYHATVDTGDWNGIKQTLSFERDYSDGWLQHTPDWNDNIYWAGNSDVSANTQVFSFFVFNKNKGDAPQFIPYDILSQQWDFQWPGGTYLSSNDDTNFLGNFGFKSQLTDNLTIEDEAYGGDNNYQRVSFSNPDYSGQFFLDDQGTSDAFWLSFGPPGMYNPAAVFPYTGSQAYGQSVGVFPSGAFYQCAPDCAFAGTDYHFYGYNAALYGDRLQATLDLPDNKIIAGGDYNLGVLHSREYWYGSYDMPKIVGYDDAWDEHDSRAIWSAYIQDDIHVLDDRLHITPGLRYDQSTIKDNDALGFFYVPAGSINGHEHYLSPTIGANFEVTPDFTILGAYGKNVKFPDVTALYNELGFGGAVPPVTAQPEYAEDYELGARYRWNTLLAELNVYQENFSNILYTIPVPGGFGATEQLNGGGERFRGVEMQFTDEFGEFWIGNWKGYLNGSYNEAVCTSFFTPFSGGGSDTGNGCNIGEQLPNVPRYLLTSGLIWDYDGWHVDLQGRYVGQQELLDYSTGLPVNPATIEAGQPTKIPDYFLINVGIVKVVPITWGPSNALRFALHVDNLFDKKYYSEAETNYRITDPNSQPTAIDFYGITGEPRAVFGSVSMYFN